MWCFTFYPFTSSKGVARSMARKTQHYRISTSRLCFQVEGEFAKERFLLTGQLQGGVLFFKRLSLRLLCKGLSQPNFT